MHQLLISSGLLFFYIAHIFIFFHSFFEGFDYHFFPPRSPFLSLMPFSLPPYYSRSLSSSSCPSSPQPITAHFRRTENSRFGFQDFANGHDGGCTECVTALSFPNSSGETQRKDGSSVFALSSPFYSATGFRSRLTPFNRWFHVRKDFWPFGASSETISPDVFPYRPRVRSFRVPVPL